MLLQNTHAEANGEGDAELTRDLGSLDEARNGSFGDGDTCCAGIIGLPPGATSGELE